MNTLPALPTLLRGLVPAQALVVAGLVPLGLTLLALVSPGLAWAALALDGLLLALATIDGLRLRAVSVDCTRSVRRIWSVGRTERLTLLVENGSRRALRLRVHQTLFEGATAEGLPVPLRVGPGGVAEVIYRAQAARRGRYRLGPQHIRALSPWGLWERQIDVPGGEEIQVWPDVHALREYDLLARTNRQGLMLQTVKRPGSESEFDRLRPWQRGDEYRLVDWKATARASARTREPVVRQMRQATDQDIVFLLDCGRGMSAEWKGRPALDDALNALLLLAHVAARQGDKAGLIAFDHGIRAWQPPVGGSDASRKLVQAVCDLHPTLEEPDYAEAFALLRSRVRRRSLVVLFSNLVDEATAQLLQRLLVGAKPHLICWVCLRDPGVEAMVEGWGEDEWERGAAAEILVWRRRVLDQAAARGVMVLDCAPAEFTPGLLDAYLEIKARQLI